MCTTNCVNMTWNSLLKDTTSSSDITIGRETQTLFQVSSRAKRENLTRRYQLAASTSNKNNEKKWSSGETWGQKQHI